MDLLGALGVLVRVAEAGSFSAVAREREIGQSAVTRQISQFDTPDGVQTVRVSGGFIANDSSAVRLAARAGHGIALLARFRRSTTCGMALWAGC